MVLDIGYLICAFNNQYYILTIILDPILEKFLSVFALERILQSRNLRIMFYGTLWTIMSLILMVGIHKYNGLQNRPIILKYT